MPQHNIIGVWVLVRGQLQRLWHTWFFFSAYNNNDGGKRRCAKKFLLDTCASKMNATVAVKVHLVITF